MSEFHFSIISYFGGGAQIRTGDRGVADHCLTTWLHRLAENGYNDIEAC